MLKLTPKQSLPRQFNKVTSVIKSICVILYQDEFVNKRPILLFSKPRSNQDESKEEIQGKNEKQ